MTDNKAPPTSQRWVVWQSALSSQDRTGQDRTGQDNTRCYLFEVRTRTASDRGELASLILMTTPVSFELPHVGQLVWLGPPTQILAWRADCSMQVIPGFPVSPGGTA
ncbi:hypothetical protein TWF594_001633 [Orbilia oligospora]|nr:hypothetical protein TWF706_002470 [Orbilia oligospora]KAF3125213.1 hypothetical protein TWF594_001633 [Orbilia oligospora]